MTTIRQLGVGWEKWVLVYFVIWTVRTKQRANLRKPKPLFKNVWWSLRIRIAHIINDRVLFIVLTQAVACICFIQYNITMPFNSFFFKRTKNQAIEFVWRVSYVNSNLYDARPIQWNHLLLSNFWDSKTKHPHMDYAIICIRWGSMRRPIDHPALLDALIVQIQDFMGQKTVLFYPFVYVVII